MVSKRTEFNYEPEFSVEKYDSKCKNLLVKKVRRNWFLQ